MKSILAWVGVLLLAALVIGCGGGGGASTGGTTGGTTGSTLTGIAPTGFAAGGTMLDPRDLVPGDSVRLDLTGYDSKQNLKKIAVSGWTTTAPSSVATLTSDGLLTAIAASPTAYSIQVTYGGTTYKTGLTVTAAKALVTGLVRNVSNPVNNVGVDFFDGSGTQVGTAFTSRDGTFRASVPTTAVRFSIDMSLADPGYTYYYNEFAYKSGVYLETDTCRANLSVTLSTTNPTALPASIVVQEKAGGLPPPPPTGCVG